MLFKIQHYNEILFLNSMKYSGAQIKRTPVQKKRAPPIYLKFLINNFRIICLEKNKINLYLNNANQSTACSELL